MRVALGSGANSVSEKNRLPVQNRRCYHLCAPSQPKRRRSLLKNSLIPTGRSAVLRLILPAILMCGVVTGCGPQAGPAPRSPQSPTSPQVSLAGQWRTVLQGNNVTITFQANGQYMQVGVPQNGGTQTAQGGPYALVAPNTIIFTVTDWSPKTRMIYVPNPRCGIPGVPNPTNPNRDSCNQWQEETMPEPPGSRYAYVFNGPNALTLNNEQAQETITFNRVTGQ